MYQQQASVHEHLKAYQLTQENYGSAKYYKKKKKGSGFVYTDKSVVKRRKAKHDARRKKELEHLERYEKRYNIDQ